MEALHAFEPYGQKIYVRSNGVTDTDSLIKEYIKNEQKNTNFDLGTKIYNIDHFNANEHKNICILDCNELNQKDMINIDNIQNIINETNKLGTNKINNLTLIINSLETIHQNQTHKLKKYSIDKYLDDNKPKRWDIINFLIQKRNYSKYLEIGVHSGECIRKIKAKIKDGVDPGAETNNPNEVNYPISSDAFFASIDESVKYDLIFIDGLHHSDQVNRDIENALKHLNENGTIVLHDCNPPEYEIQTVPRNTGLWNGDVWKTIAKLRCFRDDLYVAVVDADWGVGIVHKGKQKLYDNVDYDHIVNNWNYFDRNRDNILNIISLEKFYSIYN